MNDTSGLFFEIIDHDQFVRFEPLKSYDSESPNDWDKNVIISNVSIKGGMFTGHYKADFMTTDFELLKRGLKKLYRDIKGSAKFEPLERGLKLNIIGDGLGHFNVECQACDHPVNCSTLSFSLTFDQTELPKLIDQLDRITKTFPINGNFSIKNE